MSSWSAWVEWARATCWQLARRGKSVLGLDRYDIPNAMGSSHGVQPHHPPRLLRASRLRADPATRLRALAGNGAAGGRAAPAGSPARSTSALTKVRSSKARSRAAAMHGLDHELLERGRDDGALSGLSPAGEFVALHQPEGGFVASERAIVCGRQPRDAERRGAARPRSGAGIRTRCRRRRARAHRPRCLRSGPDSLSLPAHGSANSCRACARAPSRNARCSAGFSPNARTLFALGKFPVSNSSRAISATSISSRCGTCRASRSGSIITCWSGERPSRLSREPTPRTSTPCAEALRNSSPTPMATCSRSAPACSRTRPTSTSSSTAYPASRR